MFEFLAEKPLWPSLGPSQVRCFIQLLYGLLLGPADNRPPVAMYRPCHGKREGL